MQGIIDGLRAEAQTSREGASLQAAIALQVKVEELQKKAVAAAAEHRQQVQAATSPIPAAIVLVAMKTRHQDLLPSL